MSSKREALTSAFRKLALFLTRISQRAKFSSVKSKQVGHRGGESPFCSLRRGELAFLPRCLCTIAHMLLIAPLNTSHSSPRLYLQRNKVHSPAGDTAVLGVGWLSCSGGGFVVLQHRWQRYRGSSERLVGWRWCRPKMSSAGPGSPALSWHSHLLGNLGRATVARGSARLY